MKNDTKSKAATAVKIGKLAFDALKGAAVGGPHGALAGAVIGLIPSLIKPLGYALLALLLIPFAIFVAVPSSLFGFAGSNNPTAQQLTQQAEAVDALYQDFGRYTKEEAERLIREVSTDAYDESGLSGENNPETLSPLSYEWVSAICSVLVQQDLSQVDEVLMRRVARASLELDTEIITWEEEVPPPESKEEDGGTSSVPVSSEAAGGGDSSSPEPETVTKTKLVISVFVRSADATMDHLEFDDFSKGWAAFMQEGMSQKQLAPPGFEDSIGDLGDITFTEGATEVVYYNQRDERWAGLPYGTVNTIGEAACGPTSLAMVISSLTGQAVTPPEMAEWSYQHGYYIENGGSYHALIPAGAKGFGLEVEGAGKQDAQKIVDALSSGKLVIAIMGPGHFTTGGHFLVLRGVTASGKILVADSFRYDNSEKEWELSLILEESKQSNAAGGPFWIIGGAA